MKIFGLRSKIIKIKYENLKSKNGKNEKSYQLYFKNQKIIQP
jgi:hypothetical protein